MNGKELQLHLSVTWPDEHSAQVMEDGQVVAAIKFEPDRCEWVADAGGQSLSCSSFDGAVRFVADLRQPETIVRVLRTPSS